MSRRSRQRRHLRGAAFTELLAIMPALIMINMALLYLWNCYAAKQWTMYESRHGAWTPAMTGCQQQQQVGQSQKSASTPDSSLEQLSGQVQEAKQHASTQNLRAPFEQLTRQTNGARAQGNSWNVSAGEYGGFASTTYASQGSVLCNEVPKTLTQNDEKRAVDDAWRKYVGQ